MTILKLAWRNIKGAGLMTWLNAVVLSVAYVMMIGAQGMMTGWNEYTVRVSHETEWGGGQIWSPDYDPFEMITIQDMNAPLPPELIQQIDRGDAVPQLLYPALMYPKEIQQNVILRGIPPEQGILNLATTELTAQTDGSIPVLLGHRWAESLGIEAGETFTLQWRDSRGSYDARDATVVHILKIENAMLDRGYLWLALDDLWALTGLEGSASFLVLNRDLEKNPPSGTGGWITKSVYELSENFRSIMALERIGGTFYYIIFLSLALLAIFDTQVLHIWRRKREIGMLMALGMTRLRLITLFTLEGAMHGLFAAALAAIWGTPLLIWFDKVGINIPYSETSTGILLPPRFYPSMGLGLIVLTFVITMLAVTFVSWLPARKLAHLTPTEALRGNR